MRGKSQSNYWTRTERRVLACLECSFCAYSALRGFYYVTLMIWEPFCSKLWDFCHFFANVSYLWGINWFILGWPPWHPPSVTHFFSGITFVCILDMQICPSVTKVRHNIRIRHIMGESQSLYWTRTERKVLAWLEHSFWAYSSPRRFYYVSRMVLGCSCSNL